ncbi:hypothetical protein EV421DRAFT_1744681 [Armillaria borealis]|uniref:Uncharacterized protein n=1 Tax=Armillaria borealis TaxID=47425 RepID=A0AA39MD80_9AGAR|nr:hypothetical protein EV421DRAFT_1744681 [Armillaria borealis]
MALRFETANWECLQHVVENQNGAYNVLFDLYIIQKSYTLCRRDEANVVIQLSHFSDPLEIERNFYVDSMGSGKRKFLMWKQNQEEVILHYQGIVTQACMTPFINSNARCTRPGSICQYVQVISVPEDAVFDQVRTAIRQIHAFMADFASKPDRLLLHDSHFGGTKAVQVFFYEWISQGDNLNLEVRDNGRTLKPGHVVDIGVVFRLIRSKRTDTRFLTKLDSMTIIDRNGSEMLKDMQRSNNTREDQFKGPKRKHMTPCTLNSQAIFSGSNTT